MKRFITLIIVIAMLGVCAGAVASDVSDSLLNALRKYNDAYKDRPSAITEYHLMYAYSCYEGYLHFKTADLFENAASVQLYGDNTLMKSAKLIAKGNLDLASIPVGTFTKWVNGEVTMEVCADELFTMIDILINSIDKASGE